MTQQESARSALTDALLAHEEDAFVVLRVVRGPGGEVADLVLELANAAARRIPGPPLLVEPDWQVQPGAASVRGRLLDLAALGGSLAVEVEVPPRGEPAAVRRTYQVYARPVGTEWVVCHYRDITELREVQRALQEQAWHDPLTGLPNRRLLLDHLQQALARLARHEAVVVLLFCDLDAFKQVNDDLGHAAGDELLQEVGRRLSSAVRPEDTVARFGGDEFVVLCEGAQGEVHPMAMATRIREGVIGEYDVRGVRTAIGMSVGAAATDRRVAVDELLGRADAALYRAKRSPDHPIAVS